LNGGECLQGWAFFSFELSPRRDESPSWSISQKKFPPFACCDESMHAVAAGETTLLRVRLGALPSTDVTEEVRVRHTVFMLPTEARSTPARRAAGPMFQGRERAAASRSARRGFMWAARSGEMTTRKMERVACVYAWPSRYAQHAPNAHYPNPYSLSDELSLLEPGS
jgi:hypothetical protein